MKPDKKLNTSINELLVKRWSPRAFEPKQVTDEEITKLFEAIRWAPSAFNEQPWHFIYADRKDMEAFDNIHACLVEGNKSWTKNASMLIITFAKSTFDRNGKDNAYAEHDLGGAIANMTFQAQDMNLFVHQMAGIQKDMIMSKFNVPAGWQPLTMVAVGYLADSEKLDERLRTGEEAEQKRNNLEEIHSMNEW